MQQATELRVQRIQAMRTRWRRAVRALRQFLYGLTVYEMVRDLEKERAHLERLLGVATLGGALGLPLPSSYYGLRLLPYLLPHLAGWRRSLAWERDPTDLCEQDLS